MPSIDVALCLVMTASVFYGFAEVMHERFVDWDDINNFVKNPWFAKATAQSFAEVWRAVVIGVYQPLSWTGLLLQRLIFGLDARVIHTFNVLLHCLNTLLLYGLTIDLLRADRSRSDTSVTTDKIAVAIAALWMMLHPLKVEVVAWASCQPYLWAAMWTLACLWLYVRAHPQSGKPRKRNARWALACFVLGLLSKTWAIGLPLILLLLDHYPLRRHRTLGTMQLVREKTPYIAFSLLSVMVGIWARSHSHELPSFTDRGLAERFARAGIALRDYAQHLVLPTNLAAFYPEPADPRLWSVEALSGYLIFGILMLAAWLLRGVWPALIVALTSFVILVFPNLGFVATGRVIGADRYTYLASLAIAPVLAAASARVAAKSRIALAAVVLCGVLGASTLLSLSRTQSAYWSDSISLWQRALEMASDKTAELYFNVARSLELAGKIDEAIDVYHKSLAVDPNYLKSLQNLGAKHLTRGEYDLALRFMTKQISLSPNDPVALSNMGLTLSGLGRIEEAHAHLLQAVTLAPSNPDFTLNLALLYLRIGRADQSLLAIERLKSHGISHYKLDIVHVHTLLRLERFQDAREALAVAIPSWRREGADVRELECLSGLLQASAASGSKPSIPDGACRSQ